MSAHYKTSLKVYYGVLVPNEYIKHRRVDEIKPEPIDPLEIVFHDDVDGCLSGIGIYNDSYSGVKRNFISFVRGLPTWDEFLASWNKSKYKELFTDNFVPEEREYRLHIITQE